jgi:hypothetical protein
MLKKAEIQNPSILEPTWPFFISKKLSRGIAACAMPLPFGSEYRRTV